MNSRNSCFELSKIQTNWFKSKRESSFVGFNAMLSSNSVIKEARGNDREQLLFHDDTTLANSVDTSPVFGERFFLLLLSSQIVACIRYIKF